MELRVVDSGSTGNTYVVNFGQDTFILDCGCRLIEVKKYLNFNMGTIRGCFVSHGHSDHNRFQNEYSIMGIEMILPYIYSKKTIEKYSVKNFNITAFDLPHNGKKNYGILLTHTPTNERLLYLTDMEYCKYNFKNMGVDHILIECNYQKEYINLDDANKEHKIVGHCELNTTLEFVKANKTSELKNVMLVHLGQTSTDEQQCLEKMKEVTGENVNVYVAHPNTTYNFDSKINPLSEVTE